MPDLSQTNYGRQLDHLCDATPVVDACITKTTSVDEAVLLYIGHAAQAKDKARDLGATVEHQQEKMRLINEIISEINNCTDEKDNSLNLNDRPHLQELLETARQLGVKLPEDIQKTLEKRKETCELGKELSKEEQFKDLNSLQRDRLLENLRMAGDNWDKDNRIKIQKLDIMLKELDRLLMLVKEAFKNSSNISRATNAGMKGG